LPDRTPGASFWRVPRSSPTSTTATSTSSTAAPSSPRSTCATRKAAEAAGWIAGFARKQPKGRWILSKAIFDVPPREILDTHPVMTVVGGKVAYEAK
jgi:hypothetical protein